MSKFQMFDSVTLNQDIQLHSGGTSPPKGLMVRSWKYLKMVKPT